MQDTRVGRFLSIDPLAKQFPSLTPYQFASNDPIESIDLDGEERYDYRWVKDDKGKSTLKLIGKTDIVDRVVVGYTSGHSFGNDAPIPTYETRVNQRQEFIVHTDWEVYLDNNGGLNMDDPQRKETFDVRTFYKTKSDMLKGINGRQSLSDRLNITLAVHASTMGPENAALPALGAGNLRGRTAAARGALVSTEAAMVAEVEMTTVGRWMSKVEYTAMQNGKPAAVGAGGKTSVTVGGSNVWNSAKKGSVYVEFDVPTSSLVQGGEKGIYSIIGADASASQKAALAKQGGVVSPPVQNITPILEVK